jgi:2-polyprenyl-6-methoxyphenol hydroxylase-like FAD-dependent oxidoreductase
MLLARGGCDVLLIDRARAGSDTLSTHALMRGGVLQLHRWGLLEAIVAAGTPPVHTVVFDYPDERVPISIKPSRGVNALYAPRRTVLDRVIVDAASKAGAEVGFEVMVTDLLRDGSAVTGVAGRNSTGPFRATADLVVGADGIRSTVARLVDAPMTRVGSSANAVVYGYWEGVESAGYEWFYRPGFAAGVIPTNEDHTLIFSALSPDRFHAAATGDLDGAFRAALTDHAPELLQRVDGGTRVERLRGFKGATGFMRRPWGPGWALVGDAAYYKDPITVHGITDALRDAELLARAILDGVEATNLARYESERDRISHALFDVTDKIASRNWTMPEVKTLLRRMNDSMADEIEVLESLGPTAESLERATPTTSGESHPASGRRAHPRLAPRLR